MKLQRFVVFLMVFLALAACSAPETGSNTTDSSVPAVENTSESLSEVVVPASTPSPAAPAAASSDCLEGERSRIGEAIAEDYAFTDYEEVVSWFCDGAEFEDILVALETEDISGVPVEDTLQMLADGFNWEEIWQLLGLTE